MKRILLPLALLVLTTATAAQAQSLSDSLLSCDSHFFSELYAQQAKFKHVAPIATDKQKHAWFVPPKDGGNYVWFAQPVRDDKLTISGYYTSYDDFKDMGEYYFWGLIIDESPEIVMAALSTTQWHKAGDEYFSNPMIKRTGEHEWQINAGAASGIAPAKGAAEKITLLNAYNGKTQLFCSVQGSVTNDELLALRPDLQEAKQ